MHRVSRTYFYAPFGNQVVFVQNDNAFTYGPRCGCRCGAGQKRGYHGGISTAFRSPFPYRSCAVGGVSDRNLKHPQKCDADKGGFCELIF